MGQEYRSDDVLQVLEAEEPMKRLADDKEMLSALMIYCRSEYETIAKKINDNTEKRNTYIKGLVSLYPLTFRIIESVILIGGEKVTKINDFLPYYDISEKMEQCFRKFQSVVNLIGKDQGSDTTDLENAIAEYEQKIADYRNQIAKVKKYKDTERDRHDEAQRLAAELKSLQEEWSEEAIERKLQKARADIAQATSRKEEANKKLDVLRKELEKINGTKSDEFDQALRAFSKLMDKMPEDVSKS